MSIFGSIVSAIFGHKTPTPVGGAAATPAPKGAPTAGGEPATGKPMTTEEVEAMIEKIADAQDDLMKLLKLDSSLSARKQLAQELGYTGALDGSAEMNIWLHKQVMTKLAEGGGVVPASLKHA